MDQVATSNLISRDSPARRLGPMHRLQAKRVMAAAELEAAKKAK
jgi:hypothetical protein